MSKERLWTKDFIAIWICNFLVFLTFYYLLVTLPVYTLQELGGSESAAGLLITVFLIAAILIRPFAGRWAIAIGNRAVLLIGLLLFVICSGLYMFPDTVGGLMFIRILHGLGFGIATTATGAFVANIIPENRKGEGMGYYALSLNIAVVAGPFLGLTAVQHWGANVLFGIVLGCSLLAIGMTLFLSKSEKDLIGEQSSATEGKKLTILEKTAVPISVVAALFAIIYSSILSFVPVYARDLGIMEASSYFFVVYALLMILSRPFTGRWLDLYGPNIIVYPSIILFAAGMFLLSIAETTLVFLLAAALIGLGWGTLFPTFQTISVQNTAPEKRGMAMATFLSIFDFGIGMGSFIVGIVVVQFSLHSFYFYSSFILLFGVVIYNMMHGRKASAKFINSRKTV